MTKCILLWTVVAVLGVGLSAIAADDDKDGADGKKSTAQEREILAADELLDKLSTSNKGKLTKLVNSGSAKELMALPGIGKVTADLIIEARPLESTAHLVTVKNIGLKTIEKIVAFVDKDGLSAPPPESKPKSSKSKSESKS